MRCARRNSGRFPKGCYGGAAAGPGLIEIKAASDLDEQRDAMSSPAPRPSRITLVEDDVSLLNALGFALEADGYAVSPYTTATEALELAEPADCLVVDLKLPDIDGLTLIARLRERGVVAPAILITTHPDDRCRRSAAEADVEILEKPLMGPELHRRIDAAIEDARR